MLSEIEKQWLNHIHGGCFEYFLITEPFQLTGKELTDFYLFYQAMREYIYCNYFNPFLA
jgi:hypothetical protein